MKRDRNNTEMVLYGLLVGLVLQGGLDTAYHSSLLDIATWQGLRNAIFVTSSLQVLIFLLTLIRFVFGAYRVHEEYEESHLKQNGWRNWNFVGTLILFVLFYITGLTIKSAEPFYACLGVIHCWDFIWFIFPALCFGQLNSDLKGVFKKFLGIDLVTALALFFWVVPSGSTSYIRGTIIMICLAVADFWLLWKFYFPPSATSGKSKS